MAGTIRAHVEGCRKALSVPVDLCECGGRDFRPEPFVDTSPEALKRLEGQLRAWLDKEWSGCCDTWKEGGPSYCYNCACSPQAHALRKAADVLAALRAQQQEQET